MKKTVAGKEVEKMSLKTHVKRCKGCGICVEFCPKTVLALDETGKITVAAPENCVKCRQCEMRCPDYAIFVEE